MRKLGEYKIESWPSPQGGMQTGKIGAGVKVICNDTGYYHCCNAHRSQAENIKLAIEHIKIQKLQRSEKPAAKRNGSASPAPF